SKPRMCLMSVVLPAPLAPTRPKTTPRGKSTLTSSSATTAPKRRVSARTSTTGPAAWEALSIMASLLLGARGRRHGLVALAYELEDFLHADVELARLGEQSVDALSQDLQPFAPR